MFTCRSVWFSQRHMFMCPQLSCQMVELFEACQQQPSDLERKEVCRARLQQDIQQIFPCMYDLYIHILLCLAALIFIHHVPFSQLRGFI